jgi:hypothetical protein
MLMGREVQAPCRQSASGGLVKEAPPRYPVLVPSAPVTVENPHPERPMPENFTTAATFTDPGEAEIACARLRDEGIAAFVMGEIATGVFPGLGATSQVQVQVPEADLERAREVLAASREQAKESAGLRSLFWSCPGCGWHADYETELCPACGALLDPPYDPDLPPEPAEEAAEEKEPDAGPSTRADTWVGDKLATRAFRAAIAGLFVWWPCPPIPLGALYSLYVLCRLVLYSGEVSASGVGKCLVAFVIDLFLVLLWFFLLLPFSLTLLLWLVGRG